MKYLLLITVISLGWFYTSAQSIGIGTVTPHASAQLDVTSTSKGILIPRVTSVQRTAIVSPAKGLLIHDSTVNSLWYYDGNTWMNLLSPGSGWQLSGNSGTNPSTHFMGTADNSSLSFKVNNQKSGYIGNAADGNVFWGYQSGMSNTATGNVGIGIKALYNNITRSNLVAIGDSALYSNTAGDYNNAIGFQSLYSNTSGAWNNAMGYQALHSNTQGDANCAYGNQALLSNTTGSSNTAIGWDALASNTTGNDNTANGSESLHGNTTANGNTANGSNSLYSNTTGYSNTANGSNSLYYNTTGFSNTANGSNSLVPNTTGFYNTAIGSESLNSNGTGFNNTALGFSADVTLGNLTNATAIGAYSQVGCSNCLVLGNGANVGIGTSSPSAQLHIASVDVHDTARGAIIMSRYWIDPSNLRASAIYHYFNSSIGKDQLVLGVSGDGGGSLTLPTLYSNAKMVIESGGNVGIGITAPTARLDITKPGGDTAAVNIRGSQHISHFFNGTTEDTYIRGGKAGSMVIINDYSGSGNVGIGTTTPGEKLSVAGNVCATGSFISCSDIRFKKNILLVEATLSKVLTMQAISYDWDREKFPDKMFSDKRQIGFSAQEMEKLFPEIVQTDANGYKAIDYSRVTPILVEAIKEQQKQIEEQKELNEDLKARLEKLEKIILRQVPG